MEEIFCDFRDFFRKTQEEAARKQQEARQGQQQRRSLPGNPPACGPQQRQIYKASQGDAQGHEQPQPARSRHAAQQKQQAGKQEAEEQIPQQRQLLQPEAPPHFAHQVIHQTQGRAAGQTQQCLQPLYAGIDLHQPRSLPRSPRRGWALSL